MKFIELPRPAEKMVSAVETVHSRILEVKESAADLSQLESELRAVSGGATH